MVYAIQVMKGKEKTAQRILKSRGINCRLSPIGEYLLTDVAPYEAVRDIPIVYRVLALIDDEALNLSRVESIIENTLKEGSIVEVTDGEYRGFKGIVRNIAPDAAEVDLGVYGHIIKVSLKYDILKEVKLPEPWR